MTIALAADPIQAQFPDAPPPSPGMQPLVPVGYFATPIWQRQILTFADINPPLVAHLEAMERDTPSISRSNIGGWHSPADLHRDPVMAPLRRVIEQVALRCAQAVDFDFSRGELAFQNMWANRNGPGDFNTQHVHPNSFLSGSYYLAVPEGSGHITFCDPVRERTIAPYPLRPGSMHHASRFKMPVREGLLLIFPSWLPHEVPPNRSAAMRYSIAFNIQSRSRVGRQPSA